MGLVSVIAIYSSKISDDKMDISGVIVVFLVSMFTVTYFVCFFGDMAEGLLISIYLEEMLKEERDELEAAPKEIQKLYEDEK